MALVMCKTCGATVSEDASSCPKCGSVKFYDKPLHKRLRHWKPLALLFIGMVVIVGLMLPKDESEAGTTATPALTQQPKQQENTPAPKVEITCVQDYTLCKDNAEIANDYQGMSTARAACTVQLDDSVKYGEPDLPFIFSFGSFMSGTDAPSSGYIELVEKNAKIQNAFGAMVRSTVRCVYDLKDKEVQSLRVNSEVAFFKPRRPEPKLNQMTDAARSVQPGPEVEAPKRAVTQAPSLKPAKTNEDCVALIRVAAMADDYVRQCRQKPGVSDAAMNQYSRSNCARLVNPDEINITRKQVAFDATSTLNREGQAAYCQEAGEFFKDKAELFGLE